MRPVPGTPWGSLASRLAWARAFRRTLAARHRELTSVVSREIGKPPFECFVSEMVPLLRAIRRSERSAGRLMRERRIDGGGLFSPGVAVYERRVPLGRVGIIATWNYPVGLLGVQLVHALITGNRVLVKPSERSPLSQRLLLDIASADHGPDERTLPPGVLERMDASREAGEALIALAAPAAPDDQRVDHVVFTGSTEVGRSIAATLAGSLTPSTLELSGRDSALVLADADAALAARSIWAAACLNAGQTCMGPRRAIVASSAYEAFLRALEPLVDSTGAVTLIDPPEAARAWADAGAAMATGARPLGVGSRAAVPPDGRAMRPIAVADCTGDEELVRGRHFGPVLAIVRAADDADVLRRHAATDQHLATSIFTGNARRARREIAPRLGSTIVTVNDCVVPTGHPAVGLGGIGPSGWGISRGREGLLAMTRPISITTTHRALRTPTRPLEGRAAERFMRFAASLLGR